MTPLRKSLSVLSRPVEVEAIEAVVDRVETGCREALDSLRRRIAGVIEDLDSDRQRVGLATSEAIAVHDETGEGQGVLATLRATVAPEQVAMKRKRVLQNLTGAAQVLARRVRRALVLAEEADTLQADVDFGSEALAKLGRRAENGGLERETNHIERTIASLKSLNTPISILSGPLTSPVQQARQLLMTAKIHCTNLASDEAAATLGESLFDRALPEEGGAVTQTARKWLGEALFDGDPGTRPEEDWTESLGTEGQITDAERQEEALRRAAEDELDAL